MLHTFGTGGIDQLTFANVLILLHRFILNQGVFIMAKTTTGSIPIGIRCNCTWMSDIGDLASFAKENGFECVDTGAWAPEQIKALSDAGVALGSVDLPEPWGELAAADSARRTAAVDRCVDYVKSVYEYGARVFFVCPFGDDAAENRRAAMDHAIAGYGRLCEQIAGLPGGGAKIVLEGWPGPAPNFPVLACTPEGCRTIIEGTGAANLGVNFDPSHLIRMGVDPVRFLEEFVSVSFHVHGKDTEILGENLYEYGTLQTAVAPPSISFGETYWRYTIPGHGCARWGKLLGILANAGYGDRISI